MEIYKSNKILVLAFKRFSRGFKVKDFIDFPIEGLNIGPFVKCKYCVIQLISIKRISFMISMELSTTMGPCLVAIILLIAKTSYRIHGMNLMIAGFLRLDLMMLLPTVLMSCFIGEEIDGCFETIVL